MAACVGDGALVGLPWGEAEDLLRSAEIPYTFTITTPPGRTAGIGELRVVGERPLAAGRQVVLAHIDYPRAPRVSTERAERQQDPAPGAP